MYRLNRQSVSKSEEVKKQRYDLNIFWEYMVTYSICIDIYLK